jgi:transposase
MAVIGAAMHKLLRQVFGVLKSRKPFDPYFLPISP